MRYAPTFWDTLAKVGGIMFTIFVLIICFMIFALIIAGEIRSYRIKKYEKNLFNKKIEEWRNDFK